MLADALFLIGQAWVKREAGNPDGAANDIAEVVKLVPVDTVEAIFGLIEAGQLPEPGEGPAAVDAWLEACRTAGAGEWTLTRILFPSAAELAREEHEAFLDRLDKIRAEAEARQAAGELGPPPPPSPRQPPPWERDPALPGLSKPGALSESLRKMGLM